MDRLSFSDLPADICFMILLELQSPQDVYATIRASRACNDIFKLYKSKILCASVRNESSMELVLEAVLACKAGRVLRVNTHGWRDLSGEVSECIEEFLNNDYQTTYIPNFFSTEDLNIDIIPICRLWSIVDWFVKDYAKYALQSLSHFISAQNKIKNIPASFNGPQTLSQAEYERIQKAFFRFEVYRKLFGRSGHYPDQETERLYDKYTDKLFECEIEEIRSIQEYLSTKVQEIIHGLEDELVARALKKSQLTKSKQMTSVHWIDLERYGYRFLELKSTEYHTAQAIAEFGLCVVKDLLSKTVNKQMDTLKSLDHMLFTVTSESVIQTLPDPMRFEGSNTPTVLQERSQDPDCKSNAAEYWKFYNKIGYHTSDLRRKLRSTGLLFWDKSRLNNFGKNIMPFDDRCQDPDDLVLGTTVADRLLAEGVDRECLRCWDEDEEFQEPVEWLNSLEYYM